MEVNYAFRNYTFCKQEYEFEIGSALYQGGLDQSE